MLERGIPVAIAAAPMRTARPLMLRAHYSNPERELTRMRDDGRLIQIAHGTYMAKPDFISPAQEWRPPVEEAAMAYATAQYGDRVPVLIGLSAARFHHAIPRAIGVAVIAVPEQHRPVELRIGGRVVFTTTDVDRIDARLERGEIGSFLVATLEQTMIDLVVRPELGGMPSEAAAAARALRDRVDPMRVERILSSRPKTIATKIRRFMDEGGR